ncbi:MAG TPA: bifunctional acetaldehyde-CoA/alcohol dehydrogenase [Chthonomonadales bacterium]|nr:bifunctional acetaldehyde-CoA/alcohol dehydrogenase [Chthonomonadales bacterium]
MEERAADMQSMIDAMVEQANRALDAFYSYDQEQVDAITKAMALAGIDHHMHLAKMAVEETGRGVYEDKIIKNLFATEYIYNSIRTERTVGLIHENEHEDYVEVADPVGVIAGVTPVTNPTSTTMFKSIIAMKTRNPIIFAFHPSAQRCSAYAAQVMRDAALAAGAPAGCVQWVEAPSLAATQYLMGHPGIALILATGGASMVQAAYSAGKPALGVGPGNVPCYIEASADVKRAATDLMLSKTFDYGMICASEQAVIVDEAVAGEFVSYMQDNACYFLNEEEAEKLQTVAINKDKASINSAIVGRSAYDIANMSGLDVPRDTKILIAPLSGVGPDHPLSREKLSPILAMYTVKGYHEGLDRCAEMVAFGGMGHTAVIHTEDDTVVDHFSRRLKVGRLVVNSPASHGAIGDIYNVLLPSLTLGSGSFGKTTTTSNVTAAHLVNIKRVAKRRVNMQWFKVPSKIYFQPGAVRYLEDMADINRAFIVTDPVMVKLGYVDKVVHCLRRRPENGLSYVHSELFTEVEPDPSIDTVMRGVAMMNQFKPDVIIALGGGSPMDAAKAMWLFYEYPDTDFRALHLKFLDIRKKAFRFPVLGLKAKMVAIPTTSGTGSEVTPFTVITDRASNSKHPLADYEFTPDVAIVDPDFVMSIPPQVTADTGMDVLTHAVEAYVSVLASDYTDALALKAVQLVFEYLPRAYKDGSDKVAREKMHNASCIAGMAFANAFLGINHSMAHKFGGEFGIAHGRVNAVLLPYVMEYNAQKPTKFASFPKYGKFVAAAKFAEIARAVGLSFSTVDEGVAALIKSVKALIRSLDIPDTLAQCGVPEDAFLAKVEALADSALEDQCTTANPKMPLVSEIEAVYRKAYYGK